MKKHTKIVLSGLTVVGLIVAAASYAGGEYCRYGGGITERISQSLQLNEQQEEQLDIIALKMRKMKREHHQKHQQGRKQLVALLDAEQLDQGKALALYQKKHREMEVKAPEIISVMAEFTDTLSAEQKQKIKEFIEQGPRFGGHFRPGRDKGWHGQW